MVSHMLRMQKVLGSTPSVANFEKTNICFPFFPFPTLPHSGVFQHVCPMARSRRVAAPTENMGQGQRICNVGVVRGTATEKQV